MTIQDESLANYVRRLAGLDPDGKLVPMKPHVKNEFILLGQEHDRHVQDYYLCRALGFT